MDAATHKAFMLVIVKEPVLPRTLFLLAVVDFFSSGNVLDSENLPEINLAGNVKFSVGADADVRTSITLREEF